MVSAAGLLFIGIQTKNLHLSDRMRALTAEYRQLRENPAAAVRREQLVAQLDLFQRRVRLSQLALQFLLVALLCFVLTSLLLTLTVWVVSRLLTVGITLSFVSGVACVLTALSVEFLEMRVGLQTIDVETRDIVRHAGENRVRPPSDGSRTPP
jgi:Protein of unknown function (DUF2721)